MITQSSRDCCCFSCVMLENIYTTLNVRDWPWSMVDNFGFLVLVQKRIGIFTGNLALFAILAGMSPLIALDSSPLAYNAACSALFVSSSPPRFV